MITKKLLTTVFLPFIICVLMSFSVSTAEAQVTQEWVARYNGTAIYQLSESGPISIKRYSNGIPTEYALHINFPNPFNPVTKIRFDIPQKSGTKIIIYDILGRVIDILLDNNLEPEKMRLSGMARDMQAGYIFTGWKHLALLM